MTYWLRIVLSELRQPDTWPNDWYRWTGGQAGHAAIVGFPMALILIAFGCPPTATPVVTAAIYFWGWEVLIQRGQDWRDASADAWHVGCGAGMAAAPLVAIDPVSAGSAIGGMAIVWLIWLLTIMDGIRRRISTGADRP